MYAVAMTAHLPEPLADAWRAKGSRTGESSILLASITAETTVYESADPDDGLGALAGSEIPARSLFTVDLSVSPSLSSLGIEPESALEKAAPKAKSQFVDTLESEGLVVEEPRKTLEFEADNGAAGVWYVFDVAYPLDGAAGEDDDGDDPERIDAEGHIAVWPLESTFGMAGGILPLEGADSALDADADGTAADGSGGAALEIDPDGDRETVAELIRTIELPGAADDTEDVSD